MPTLNLIAVLTVFVTTLALSEILPNETRRGRSTLLPPQITYDIKTDTRSVSHAGKNLEGNFKSGDLHLTSNTDEVTTSRVVTPVTTYKTEYRSELQLVEKTLYRLECATEPGEGKSEAWNRFYETPGRDGKIRALDEAIKGVGPAHAEKLYDDGVFRTKPRSWNEFSRRILDASNRYRSNLASEVLEKYKYENMRNLGYNQSDVQCREVPYTQQVWDSVLVPYQVEKTENEVQETSTRRLHSSQSRDFAVKARGGKLLRGEQESFSVSLKGNEDSAYASSIYNRYQQIRSVDASGKVTYEFVGQRNQVAPENTLDGRAVVNSQRRYFLEVTDQAYDAAIGGTATVQYTVIRHFKKWGFKKSEVLTTSSMRLNDSGGITSIPLNLSAINEKKNETYEVKYTLRRTGSEFFSNQESSERTTGKVRK